QALRVRAIRARNPDVVRAVARRGKQYLRWRRGLDRRWRRGLRVVLPGKTLGVQTLLHSVGSVDPGVIAVGVGRPVIRLAPDEQATCAGWTGSLLKRVAVGGVVLVGETISHGMRNEVGVYLEAQHKLTIS